MDDEGYDLEACWNDVRGPRRSRAPSVELDDLEACWNDVRGPARRTEIQALVERILRAGDEIVVTVKEFLLLLDHYRPLIEKIPGEVVLFMGVRLQFRMVKDSE